MDRRMFVAAMGNSLATMVLGPALAACNKNGEWRFEWSTKPSFAEPNECTLLAEDPLEEAPNHARMGPNDFRVEVHLRGKPAKQEHEGLCWAAALETIFTHCGLRIDQCRIAEFMNRSGCHGGGLTGAQRGDIANAMDTVTREFGFHATTLDVDVRSLIESLAADMPVLVGIREPGHETGHVYVLTALDYCYAPDWRRPAVVKARVIDPKDAKPKKLQTHEFYEEFDFAIRITT